MGGTGVSSFCGSCGAPQTGPGSFCVNCGAPLGQPDVASFPGPAPLPTPAPRPPGSRRRHALIAGGAALGLVVVAGGVALALKLGGDGSSSDRAGTGSSQLREVSAVTESPTQSWTWTSSESGEGLGTTADGDLVVVSNAETGEVTRLDAEGTEVWRGDGVFVQSLDAANDLVWVSTEWEGDGFAALDAETGAELWRKSDFNFSNRLADGRVWATRFSDASQTYEGAVFDTDGQALWELDADSFLVAGNDVVRVEGDEVSVLDAASGDERWAVEPGLALDPDYPALRVATTDEMVVVNGVDTVVAYDLESGEELWTETDDYGSSSFSSAGGLAYFQFSGDSDTYEDGRCVVFDTTGLIETVTFAYDDYFSLSHLLVGGDDYYTDYNSGIVYDRSLQPVSSFDGDVVPAGQGFYQVFNGELSYQLLDGTEKWARQVGDPDGYAQVTPLDGRLLVTQDDAVTNYE